MLPGRVPPCPKSRLGAFAHFDAIRPTDDKNIGNADEQSAFYHAIYQLQVRLSLYRIGNPIKTAIKYIISVISPKWLIPAHSELWVAAQLRDFGFGVLPRKG